MNGMPRMTSIGNSGAVGATTSPAPSPPDAHVANGSGLGTGGSTEGARLSQDPSRSSSSPQHGEARAADSALRGEIRANHAHEPVESARSPADRPHHSSVFWNNYRHRLISQTSDNMNSAFGSPPERSVEGDTNPGRGRETRPHVSPQGRWGRPMHPSIRYGSFDQDAVLDSGGRDMYVGSIAESAEEDEG